MAEILRNVDREMQRLRRDAAEEAARIVARGKIEAERPRAETAATKDEARIAADRVLREARAEAERTISSLAEQRDEIVADLVTIRARNDGPRRPSRTFGWSSRRRRAIES